jgi:hypothetical protein
MRSEHPEVQAKIRRVIEQGHIDPEDFNGVSETPSLQYDPVRATNCAISGP